MSTRGKDGRDGRSRADALILDLARRQHGLVSRRQLLRAGLAPGLLESRLKRGRLTAVHAGVYSVGPVPGRHAREMAAVLASGEDAVLSHRTAAALWGLLPPTRGSRPIDVIVPRGRRVRRPGIRSHGSGPLPLEERASYRGLPVTSPARTVLDVAADLPPRRLERLVARAERTGAADAAAVAALVDRHPRHRGGAALRVLLDRQPHPAFTRSEAEARLLDLLRRGDLPEPLTNVVVRGLEVDLVWPDRRLVVEMDGFAHHASRRAFERDRERDAILAAAGMRVVRVTWRQLGKRPEAVLVRLAQALVAPHGPSARREVGGPGLIRPRSPTPSHRDAGPGPPRGSR